MLLRHTLIVSPRGQITLPADMRRHLGIKSGEPLIIEERNGELVLKPAVVLEVEVYGTPQIEAWDREDALEPAERAAILKRIGQP
jgi:AbrB family looped-hinge helix DNA binding protein